MTKRLLVLFIILQGPNSKAQTPTFLWAKAAMTQVYDVATDKTGNCYGLGQSGSSNFTLILRKYNNTGTQVWLNNSISYVPADPVGCSGRIRKLLIDSVNGSIYAVGNFRTKFVAGTDTVGAFTSVAAAQIFVIKFNPGGGVVWARYGYSPTQQDVTLMDAQLLHNGDVVIFGNASPGSGLNVKFGSNTIASTLNSFVTKISSSGNYDWLTSVKLSASSSFTSLNNVMGIDQDISNNICTYYVSKFTTSGSISDYYVTRKKISFTTGSTINHTDSVLIRTYSGNMEPYQIRKGLGGNYYLFGRYTTKVRIGNDSASSVFYGTYVSKLSPSLQPIKSRFGKNSTFNMVGYDMDVKQDGKLVFHLLNYGKYKSDNDSLISAGAQYNFLIFEMDDNLNMSWMKHAQCNESTNNCGRGIKYTPGGDVLMGHYTTQPMNYDAIPSAGLSGGLMAYLAKSASSINENNKYQTTLRLFPNPSIEFIYLDIGHLKTEGYDVVIYDLIGKEVLRTRNTEKIDIRDLKSGVYTVKMFINETTVPFTKLIKLD